jgi:hypothetical protein
VGVNVTEHPISNGENISANRNSQEYRVAVFKEILQNSIMWGPA